MSDEILPKKEKDIDRALVNAMIPALNAVGLDVVSTVPEPEEH